MQQRGWITARILIVDDDSVLCRMLRLNVGQMGHEVEDSFTLEQGLKKARNGDWDVVFPGEGLPDGKSLDALPVIRSVRSRLYSILQEYQFTKGG